MAQTLIHLHSFSNILLIGRNYTVPALDIDMEEVWQTFEVNVFAVIAMCQAFAPLLIEVTAPI